jgi:hypothetical protein
MSRRNAVALAGSAARSFGRVLRLSYIILHTDPRPPERKQNMRINRTFVWHAAAALLLLAAVPDIQADSFTYTYTGPDFTFFNAGGVSSPLSTSDFITASLTFASPLPDDFSQVYTGGSSVLTGTLPTPQWDPGLLGWTISDRVSTLSSSEGDILNGVLVTTDAAGNIVAWSLEGSSYTFTTGPTSSPRF